MGDQKEELVGFKFLSIDMDRSSRSGWHQLFFFFFKTGLSFQNIWVMMGQIFRYFTNGGKILIKTACSKCCLLGTSSEISTDLEAYANLGNICKLFFLIFSFSWCDWYLVSLCIEIRQNLFKERFPPKASDLCPLILIIKRVANLVQSQLVC